MEQNLNQANEELIKAFANFCYTTSSNPQLNNGNVSSTAHVTASNTLYNQFYGDQYTLTGTSITTSGTAYANNTITITDGTFLINSGAGGTTDYTNPYQTTQIVNPYQSTVPVKFDPKTIQRYSYEDLESIVRLMTLWIDDPAVTDKIKKMFDEWKKLEKIE